MATIQHDFLRPLVLPSGAIIPRGEPFQTTNDVLRQFDNVRALEGLILSGQVTVTYDPEVNDDLRVATVSITADPPTPEIQPPPAEPAPVDPVVTESTGPVDAPADAPAAKAKK